MKTTLQILSKIALLALVIGMVVLGYQYQSQQKEIALQTQQLQPLEDKLKNQEVLLGVDSLLVQGHYTDALDQYNDQQQHSIQDGNMALDLRVAIAQKFLQLEGDLSVKPATEEAVVVDQPQEDIAVVAATQTALQDSLTFALSKAQVQLASLRKQLQQKSFGSYVTFTNSNGSKVHYVGEVKNGKAHGYGTAILNTGSRYVGQWVANQREGQGTFYWKDGEYYEGNYTADRRNGQGTYYWPNGEKYVGQWKNDKRSGKGGFYNKEGKLITSGVWKEDKMITDNTKTKKRSKENNMASL